MQDTKPKLYNPSKSLKSQFSVERFEIGSLNRGRRKQELVKITVENQAILKRL